MNEILEFGPFRIDPVRRLILRRGAPVSISNKGFELLMALLLERDQVLNKDELLKKIWPDTIVEENNLTVAMSGLRKALGEGPNDHRYILTIPGRGYRFVAQVRIAPASTSSDAGPQAVDKISSEVDRARLFPFRQLGILLLVVTLGIAAGLILSSRRAGKESMHGIRSVAVLPFKTIGGAEGDQYLGVGMADALTTKLSNLSQLSVKPTSAVLRYDQSKSDPVNAGKELAVDAVLAGEIQRSESQIRITVQLISVQDGATLWADTLDRDFTSIFAVEDSISAGVSEHLALKLTDAEKKGLTRHITQNPEAYQLYLKGRYFWDKDTEEPMLKSIQAFQQAIAEDPGFALAHIGIADAYSELVLQGYMASSEGFPKAKAAAQKALQLDPALAEAHNSLGVVAWGYDWDWATAEREFQRASELNPDNVATHSDRAFYLMTMKRFDQSIIEAKRAVDLNPASASSNTTVGYSYFAARHYEDSSLWLKKALDLDPEFSFPRAVLAANDALAGKSSEALAEYAKIRELTHSGKDPLVSAIAAYACAVSGDRKDALTILDRLKSPPPARYVDPYAIAIVYAGLGDEDAALDWLERMFREHSLSVAFFSSDPFFLKLHGHPRFQELIRRSGVPN